MRTSSLRAGLAALALVAAATAPRTADAFLVVGKAKGLQSDRVTALAVREGTHTVLSIEPRVRGPAGEVALLVPVPASLAETATLKLHALDALQRIAGPRLVEYWELDPCEMHDVLPSDGTLDAAATAELATAAVGVPGPAPTGAPPAAGAGDYATETSPAKTGAELVAALKKDGYGVPDKAEALLDAYLKAGMKVVVARLDTSKLPREGEASVLPPLQLHFQSDELTLPTRLLSAGGKRELSLYVLAPGARFEAKGQPNVALPSNLDVTDGARAAPSAFYRALVDRAFEKSPGALLTEYAWRASGCELCDAPLSAGDFGALGGSLLPSATAGKQHEVLVDASAVSARPDGPAEARTALEACYAAALAKKKGLAGEVALGVEVGAEGVISSATSTSTGTADELLVKCATDGVRAGKGWKAGAKGAVSIKFAPFSRAFFAEVVLTALRARQDAAPERDLTLVPARAIEGGREMGSESAVDKRVRPAPGGNNYMARYAVRHAFPGEVKCETPTRGTWGGPPKEGARPPDRSKVPAQAGGPPSGAPDGGTRLESLIQGDAPDFAALAINFGPPVPGAAPAPAASASPPGSASPSAAPASSPPAKSGGCGDCAVGSTGERLPWAALAALAALAVRRRRR